MNAPIGSQPMQMGEPEEATKGRNQWVILPFCSWEKAKMDLFG